MKRTQISMFLALLFAVACQNKETSQPNGALAKDVYHVAILIMNGVYNTELTSPYDIFQHTQFRKGIKSMHVFTVAKSKDMVTTFESLHILPDYSYLDDSSLPHIDILVVPSAEHQLDTDLENEQMLNLVSETTATAQFVTSHCDGVFVLAEAGLLDSVYSTTFPSDIDTYKERYPQLNVKENVWTVHDGKYITSAGGARSFEAAMYLTDLLYGSEITKSLGKGLVLPWPIDSSQIFVVK